MSAVVELVRADSQAAPEAEELWLELFAHHVSIGAAGFPTISPEQSWPLRSAHYRRLFDRHRDASFWFARSGGKTLGYAMSHSEDLGGDDALVLESLSVNGRARGRGVGTQLMTAVGEHGHESGFRIGVVDVMAGNDRARELYVRNGYRPYSEVWMRSDPCGESLCGDSTEDVLAISLAAELGLRCELGPGPDDTWVTSQEIVGLGLPGSPEIIKDCFGGRAVFRPRHSGPPELEELPALFDGLAASGRWTILFEVPAAPEGRVLREFLRSHCGFKLSTERLARCL